VRSGSDGIAVSQKFTINYCDPPWLYADRREGGAANHYSLTDQRGMESWAHQFHAMRPDSGVMLMWVTGPHMETALKLMRAYSYTPIKPIFYWVKTYPGAPNIFYGPGAYTGSNVEYILLGQASMKSGRIFTPNSAGGEKGVPEVIYAPHPRDDQGKIIHSRKPAIFRDLIVQLFGDVPRVEVFARERSPGWYAIGDQLPGGEPIQAGRVIEPLAPPTANEAATRRIGSFVQHPLFG
jgi:N6-adenosine-specific RNA methylase IME4